MDRFRPLKDTFASWGLWKSRGMTEGADTRNEVLRVTQEEYEEPIRDAYIKSISRLPYAELDDKYNPGPTLPDGSVNFECHCVGHLVASPCGHEFREAIKCQKGAGETALDEGACAEEFMNFMKCVIRTECFKSRHSPSDNEEEEQQQKSTELKHREQPSNEKTNKIHDGAA